MANIKVRVGQQNAVKVLTTGAISGGGGGSLATLSDVVINALEDDQVLNYDAATQRWVNTSTVAADVDGGVF